ncbi:PREDICTED: pro-neuregulin-2, membrane-bound isoform isoform X1 [Cercocebus atys]|uniref:Pro-neuregulin-2, membrane-bound isoform n=2 Tax=Cercopithecinae TaxID=9528 RepID=A0A2K5P2H5_CERAT|nr:PREDICTED: pro-neuregulin-2, membrane-bound isoform isoform X1 [Cercocebus atys]XP_025244577.1 pro-neuregulin-2, membrane-bound isoform isoform X2 [Theropithecus gelada]XP_045250883.1 pro-neuregulin-2, membrane-bound isoform isoform X1 [Macaca fascicularis]XP_045250884.1 pro-neuregulin-2, membrane-bound isoform isoform X1 [Macaca fascicularis]
MRQVCCSALPPPPLEKGRCSSYSDSSSSSSSERSSSSSSESGGSSRSSSNNSSISRPAAPPEPRPQQQPQPRSSAARRAAARSRAAAAGGMRRDPAPGFSMLLFGVSLACYSPSLKSVQDQAYKAPVVVEGKVQGLAPAGGSSSNSTREPPASGRVALVKVLDKWPLRSGGLQREQVISVGSCAPLERNQRYIFFLEPTEQPLVFKTAFAPLDTNGKNLKKEVGKILCTDCATRPKLKKMKSQTGQVGEKQSLKCEAAAGNPQPSYRWFKDGKELNRSRDIRIKYGNGRKNSRLQFNKVKVEDAGEYVCEAENILGKDTVRGRLYVNSVSTTLSSWSGHARKCNETAKSYCVNGGVCYYIEGINQLSCKCPVGYTGDRCQQFAMVNFSKHLGFELKEAEELYQKRVLTITGICVALLVVGIVCVVAYCKTKKQRKQMHNHLRQNMCPAHQNRSLANGPSHPRLDPEEIQMADYISKNVPATDHVIRRETETTFSGSHSCSPSHHCSTATPTSSHRHESHTWSLERSESLTSDSQSGIMLSSVGTSKCNSPACVEARARRAAAYNLEERRRATVPPYHDSVDSLRDSPHSERYVSALTTPARLSPVDFHYSLATQVPTFEITSPNSAHAVSLPPAAPISYRLAEQQPLLRHPAPPGPGPGPGPGADMQRSYDSYYYPAAGPGPRRGTCALGGSLGSLPASPFRIPEDDEYETTQECAPPPPRPRARGASRRTSAGPRRWRRSRLNGLAAQRARAARDSLSLSSGSGGGSASASDDDADDADGALAAESTPFLGLRAAHDALRSDSPPLCPAADSRTYYSLDSHSTRASSRHSRGPPPRAKQDSAPL